MKQISIFILAIMLFACTEEKEPVSKMTDSELKESLSEEEYQKFMKAKSRYRIANQENQLDSLTVDEILAEQDSIDKIEMNNKKQEQIEYLSKIIERDYQKIEEYEIKIAQGDTTDTPGLVEFVKNLKEKVKEKEKRLEKLKN